MQCLFMTKNQNPSLSSHVNVLSTNLLDASPINQRLNVLQGLAQFSLCFLIVGCQQLGMQVVCYPLVIVISLVFSKRIKLLSYKYTVAPLALISLAALSLNLRDFPSGDVLNLIRFFTGFLLISFFFANSTVKLRYFSYSFIAWSLIELCFLIFLNDQPPYIKSYLSNSDIESFSRAEFTYGNLRLLGPFINSSINGTYAGVLTLMLLLDPDLIFGKFELRSKKREILLLSILSGVTLLYSGSATGFITTGFLLFLRLSPYLFILRSKYVKILLTLSLIAFASFSLGGIYFSKLDSNYLSFIFDLKLNQFFDRVNNVYDLVLGSPYETGFIYGGDFLVLSMIDNFGIILAMLVFFTAWNQCGRKYRPYFLALSFSSLHYGTIFSLTGQVLFASLVLSPNKSYDLK
ncbi:hypothetical protein CRD_00152 [Raphidiopsis brookii D9]|nr:hypothetical protein CRD_00152 [Raphidiopsis brookii D9]